jgi:inward rectifier potassium channel
MKKKNGSLEIQRVNAPRTWSQDFYHHLLSLSWPKTIWLFLQIYILINIFFATLYYFDPSSLHQSDGSFLDCFFFSVQTLGTIGYGYLAPKSIYANILVTIESALGIIMIALLTGLFFAKFSLPRSRVRFSQKVLYTNYNGHLALVFRMANERENQMIDSKIHFIWLRHEVSDEGVVMRKFVDLKLERSHAPIFAMSMTAIHLINSASPLYGKSFEEIEHESSEFFVTVIGIDGTFGQNIHATHFYRPPYIHKGGKFADIIKVESNGVRVIDFGPFDDILENS